MPTFPKSRVKTDENRSETEAGSNGHLEAAFDVETIWTVWPKNWQTGHRIVNTPKLFIEQIFIAPLKRAYTPK